MDRKKIKVYLAGGWFSEEQRFALDQVEILFVPLYDAYAPRIENLGVDGEVDWEQIYNENIQKIREADYIVVCTVGKDMGTIFEAGYAACLAKKIIYYNPFVKKMNLMLAHSAHSICTSFIDLQEVAHDITVPFTYEGPIE